MFPRKQYTYRIEGGGEQPRIDGIGEWCMNMPPGSLSYPYKATTISQEIQSYYSYNYVDDIFAIHMEDGWKFFQADRKNGNIFKMWGSRAYGVVPYRFDNNRWSTHRYAWHIDDTTKCGNIFLQDMPIHSTDESASNSKQEYISMNILPFSKAYYNYTERGCDEDDDIRHYTICSSDDNKELVESWNPWQYTIRLLPKESDGIFLSAQSRELTTIHKDNPYRDSDTYSVEEASRPIRGLISNDSILHTSWGEWLGVKTNGYDDRKYQYFEIDICDNVPNDLIGTLKSGMMLTSTSTNISSYVKYSHKNYTPLVDILRHTTDETIGIDTIIKADNKYICQVLSYPNDDLYKLKLGELIRHDDVITFIFDSCNGDDDISRERLEIKRCLMDKFNTTIVHKGDRTIDPLLCYSPDINIMADDDPFLTIIKNACKIQGTL